MPPIVPIGCNCPPVGIPYGRMYQAKPSELSYLSWGKRRYGNAPIPATGHEGWHYFIVLAGATEVVIQGRSYAAGAGFISVSDPLCPVGHDGARGQSCEMLTWIWRAQPQHSALRPLPGESLRLQIGPRLRAALRRVHRRCRDAVASATETGLLEIKAARLELDLLLAKEAVHGAVADDGFRFDLACAYLRNHREQLDPVRRLCDYLQISETSLNRLFRRHARLGPRAYALAERMRWAREHLADGKMPVKAVAYALGYRHANDFSRAFKRYHGLNPGAAQDPRANAA